MTFQTVGMTKEGKRILRFSLDAGRRHSPQVDHEGIFISWKASRLRLICANTGVGGTGGGLQFVVGLC